jgi:hypothetical protein
MAFEIAYTTPTDVISRFGTQKARCQIEPQVQYYCKRENQSQAARNKSPDMIT